MVSRNVYTYIYTNETFLSTSSLYAIRFLIASFSATINNIIQTHDIIISKYIRNISTIRILAYSRFIGAGIRRIFARFTQQAAAFQKARSWPIRGKSRAVWGRAVGRSPRSNYAPCISFLARSRPKNARTVSPGSASFATARIACMCEAGKKRYPIRYRVLSALQERNRVRFLAFRIEENWFLPRCVVVKNDVRSGEIFRWYRRGKLRIGVAWNLSVLIRTISVRR